MIKNDVTQDQIMLNSSNSWSSRLFAFLIKELTSLQWTSKYLVGSGAIRSYDAVLEFTHPNTNKSVLITCMHEVPDYIDTSNSVLVTDCFDHSDNQNCVIALNPEVYGEFQIELTYTNQLPTKNFCCFINRGDTMRQSWIYEFAKNNMLEHGHVSYWCTNRPTPTNNTENSQIYFEQLYQWISQYNKNYLHQHNWLKDKIPFKNFDLTLEQAIIDSKISIILETNAPDPKKILFSEKTWRQIQLPRPWVMLNNPYSVRYLRSLGFDVFDDYVDHSYDYETNYEKKQQMILSQLKKIKDFDNSVLDDLEHRTEHNRNILRNYKNQLPQKYKKIVEQIHSISNNESLTSRA